MRCMQRYRHNLCKFDHCTFVDNINNNQCFLNVLIFVVVVVVVVFKKYTASSHEIGSMVQFRRCRHRWNSCTLWCVCVCVCACVCVCVCVCMCVCVYVGLIALITMCSSVTLNDLTGWLPTLPTHQSFGWYFIIETLFARAQLQLFY
jgi:ABC-type proline/glycine betaine transport system permease subunit